MRLAACARFAVVRRERGRDRSDGVRMRRRAVQGGDALVRRRGPSRAGAADAEPTSASAAPTRRGRDLYRDFFGRREHRPSCAATAHCHGAPTARARRAAASSAPTQDECCSRDAACIDATPRSTARSSPTDIASPQARSSAQQSSAADARRRRIVDAACPHDCRPTYAVHAGDDRPSCSDDWIGSRRA